MKWVVSSSNRHLKLYPAIERDMPKPLYPANGCVLVNPIQNVHSVFCLLLPGAMMSWRFSKSKQKHNHNCCIT